MTKEELEKATGQELIDERNYCGVDGYYGVYLDNVNAEMLKRFNRLAELEQENADLKEEVNKVAFENGELKEENAELKEQLRLAKEMPYSAVKEFAEEKTQDQLTKAKEIIKDLLNLPFASNEEVFADVNSHLDRAEQFLKEVEK